MSDALTDIARDERRGQYYEDWLVSVYDFLLHSDSQSYEDAVYQAARQCDSIPRGYWGAPTALSARVATILDGVKSGNTESWACLLDSALGEDSWEPKVFLLLKSLSPWKNMKAVRFDYQRWSKGLNDLLREPMRLAGKGTTFGGNPNGHFRYLSFYTPDSTLQDIANAAICVEIKVDGWGTNGNHIKPTSCRLDYLEQRKIMLGKA